MASLRDTVVPVNSPYEQALHVAAAHARDWLDQLPDRDVPPRVGADEIRDRALALLGEAPVAAERVVDELAALAEPPMAKAAPPPAARTSRRRW